MLFSLEVRQKNSHNPKYDYNLPLKRRPKNSKKSNDLWAIGNPWNLFKTNWKEYLFDHIQSKILSLKLNEKYISSNQ